MPVNINIVSSSSLPPEQPAPTTAQPSAPVLPSPQDLQAKIDQGIQQAAQNLDQITGNTTLPQSGVSTGASADARASSKPELSSFQVSKTVDKSGSPF